jgi:hypothetical protein
MKCKVCNSSQNVLSKMICFKCNQFYSYWIKQTKKKLECEQGDNKCPIDECKYCKFNKIMHFFQKTTEENENESKKSETTCSTTSHSFKPNDHVFVVKSDGNYYPAKVESISISKSKSYLLIEKVLKKPPSKNEFYQCVFLDPLNQQTTEQIKTIETNKIIPIDILAKNDPILIYDEKKENWFNGSYIKHFLTSNGKYSFLVNRSKFNRELTCKIEQIALPKSNIASYLKRMAGVENEEQSEQEESIENIDADSSASSVKLKRSQRKAHKIESNESILEEVVDDEEKDQSDNKSSIKLKRSQRKAHKIESNGSILEEVVDDEEKDQSDNKSSIKLKRSQRKAHKIESSESILEEVVDDEEKDQSDNKSSIKESFNSKHTSLNDLSTELDPVVIQKPVTKLRIIKMDVMRKIFCKFEEYYDPVSKKMKERIISENTFEQILNEETSVDIWNQHDIERIQNTPSPVVKSFKNNNNNGKTKKRKISDELDESIPKRKISTRSKKISEKKAADKNTSIEDECILIETLTPPAKNSADKKHDSNSSRINDSDKENESNLSSSLIISKSSKTTAKKILASHDNKKVRNKTLEMLKSNSDSDSEEFSIISSNDDQLCQKFNIQESKVILTKIDDIFKILKNKTCIQVRNYD